MSVKKPDPKKHAKASAHATFRFLKRRGGRVPLSPSLICENMKMIARQAKPTKRPMMREEDQG